MLITEMQKKNKAYLEVPISKHSNATKLYADFLNKQEKVREYYGPTFDDDAALGQLYTQLKERDYPREELASALEELAVEIEAPAGARNQIETLRNKDSFTVFAGQQPGLFSGPLYSVYKALTLERWASELSDKFSFAVIPCFWLASDDHDFAEVNHINLPDETDINTLTYRPKHTTLDLPVGRIKLDASIKSLINELFGYIPATEFRQDVLDILVKTYSTDVTFPVAFARLWYRMFPQSQMVFVSPCQRQLKKLALPLLQQALRDTASLFSLYEETSRRLENDGYHRQVYKKSEQTFVFYQQSRRHNIHRQKNNNYILAEGKSATIDTLCEMLEEKPEDFSGNVLFNPILQNALFPTLGVVLGPSEIAYYAQIGGLYDYFDVPRPTIMPRTSVTLVQKNFNRCLSQNDIDLNALQQDASYEINRILKTTLPEELDTSFQLAERSIEKSFEEIQAIVEKFEPGLNKTVQSAAIRLQRELQRLTRKTHAAHRRKESDTERQLSRLALHLFPKGELQERHFNIVYYWTRYGPEFLSSLYEDWPVGLRNHLLWGLD
ncbi:MAG: bacillithiol biosynthesis cysteine-adding enzyme BshC [Gammaproteobacteria bacterium]|nr:bacillithiol biosynthesis cysteine-adding enzyme BshC [Gammaproteobacteria bacterium]